MAHLGPILKRDAVARLYEAGLRCGAEGGRIWC